MNKERSIDLLLTAAKLAGLNSSAEHPEDIACAMMNAIEYSWPVVLKVQEAEEA